MLRLLEGDPQDQPGVSRAWYQLNESTQCRIALLEAPPEITGWEVQRCEYGSWDASYKIDDLTVISATFLILPDKATELEKLELPDKEFDELVLSESDITFSVTMLCEAPSGFYEYVKTTVEIPYNFKPDSAPLLAEVIYESNRENCEGLENFEQEQIGMHIVMNFLNTVDSYTFGSQASGIQAS